MDIDDILASVSGPRIPQRTLDLQALTRAWVNERTAPELLPYPTELIDRVLERLRMQVSRRHPLHQKIRNRRKKESILKTNPAQVDRNRRRNDRRHEPKKQFLAYSHANRTRAIQVPTTKFIAKSDCKGISFFPQHHSGLVTNLDTD